MKEKGRAQGRKVIFWAAAMAIVLCMVCVISFQAKGEVESVNGEFTAETSEAASAEWNGVEELVDTAVTGNQICEVENPVSIVSYAYADAGMELQIPDGWEYEIEAYEPDGYAFGISFWPEDAEEGKIRLLYYTDAFGVCGTGLVTEEITLENGMSASMGTYDNNVVWSHLIYQDTEGSYAALTEKASSWWPDYEEEAMEILGNVKLGPQMQPESEM